jgi:hypothetical protein
MRRFVLAAFGLAALAGVLALRADEPASSPPKRDDSAAKVRDKLSLDEQNLARRFSEFEQALLKLKQRLERSPRQEDRDRAAILQKALDKARDTSISTHFEQLIQFLRDQKLNSVPDITTARDQSERIANDLRELLALLREDSRAAKLREERMRLEQLVKELTEVIRKERTIRGLTENGRSDPLQLARSQNDNRKATKKIDNALGKKDDKGGEGRPSKGDVKGEGKGQGKTGESKDAGKAGQPKTGESKDAGKGGEGKQGEAKGAQAQGKEGAKTAEAKAGEPKTGQQSQAKAGGQGKQGEAKTGEPKQGPPSASKAGGEKAGAKTGEAKAGGEKAGSKAGQQGEAKAGQKGGQQGGAKGSKAGQKGEQSASKGGGQQSQQAQAKAGSKSSGQGQAKAGGQQSQQQAQQGNSKGDGKNSPQQAQEDEQARARKRIQEAADQMGKAEQKIVQKKNDDALPPEDKAISELEKAKKKLEDLLRQMREEEMERLLAALQARCERMLAMQIRVYDGTVGLQKAIDTNADKKANRNNQQTSLKLSDDEKDIVVEADKAIAMLEAEGSAVAFPEVFKQVREDMKHVQTRLGVVDSGKVTQAIEEDIISTLKEMIEALKKARQELDQRKSPPGQPPPNQDQKLLDKIAELKMIRAMQVRVNTRTTMYGRQYQGEQTNDTILRRELRDLSDRQDRIFEVTNRIVRGDNQ